MRKQVAEGDARAARIATDKRREKASDGIVEREAAAIVQREQCCADGDLCQRSKIEDRFRCGVRTIRSEPTERGFANDRALMPHVQHRARADGPDRCADGREGGGKRRALSAARFNHATPRTVEYIRPLQAA